ncbi:MAG: hypothetical protein HY914_03850 [Desulfomonile tiedjei]|nr:hypothetical protein [Desulfomonile tiedjei]
MRGFKKLLAALVCLVCVPVLAVPALAWEFEMAGSMTWTYEFYSQQGNQGFFGPWDFDNDITATDNLNYWWNGPRIAQNLVTGHDASRAYFYVVLDPTIKINPAVRMKGRVRLGQWGNPQASYYNTQDSPGTDNAMSEAQWTMFWATAQTPWGTFGIGKRPWKFGTGLQYDGSDGLTTESAVLNAPYGPFDIGVGVYAHRPAKGGATVSLDPYSVDLRPVSTYSPPAPVANPVANFLSLGGDFFASHPALIGQVGPVPVVAPYFNHADKSGALRMDLVAYGVYNNGPLQMGVLGSYGTYHRGPEATLKFTGAKSALNLAQDSDFFHGTAFTKYNNGRFFFNAEAAWVYWTDRLMGADLFTVGGFSPSGVPFFAGIGPFTPGPRYTEQWRYMAEAGVMAGPSKLSVLASWSPGPDRRAGALIDRQPALFVLHPAADVFYGNYDVFRPYSFIFSYNYGSGLNAYNLSLDGYVRDAWVLAGRLDYAVAANLNVYGTFMWAERTSNGYGWGCIFPNFPFAPDGSVTFRVNGPLFADLAGTPSPNIPDRSLGWEVNAGVDWNLLEGFTIGFLTGYWQPGKWFSYACIDRSVPAWFTGAGPGNNWGTRPTKSIDPIIAGQFTMTYSF